MNRATKKQKTIFSFYLISAKRGVTRLHRWRYLLAEKSGDQAALFVLKNDDFRLLALPARRPTRLPAAVDGWSLMLTDVRERLCQPIVRSSDGQLVTAHAQR